MKKALSLTAAGAALMLAAGVATSASAATTFAGDYAVTGYCTTSNGCLAIDIDRVNGDAPDSGTFSVTNLVVGTPQTINLFNIGADESINVPDPSGNPSDDDSTQHSIHVNFTFTAPINFSGSGPDGTVNGFTVGVNGTPDFGQVNWDAPAVVDFGSSGVLTITMLNTNFGTTDDSEARTHVQARFSLAAPTGGVPEPASWALMIGGFGMAGAALRRRRTAVAAAA